MRNHCLIPILALLLALSGCGKKQQRITSLKMLEGGKTFAIPSKTAGP
jgi:hypothetical protein